MNFSRGNFLKKLILLITQNTDYSCSSLVQSFPSQGFNLSMFSIWHNSAQLTLLVWKVKLFLSPDFVTSFFCQMSLLSKQILLKARQTGKTELKLTSWYNSLLSISVLSLDTTLAGISLKNRLMNAKSKAKFQKSYSARKFLSNIGQYFMSEKFPKWVFNVIFQVCKIVPMNIQMWDLIEIFKTVQKRISWISCRLPS